MIHTTRWRRRPDRYQACGHTAVLRRREPGLYLATTVTRCCCVRCGHVWTEVGFERRR